MLLDTHVKEFKLKIYLLEVSFKKYVLEFVHSTFEVKILFLFIKNSTFLQKKKLKILHLSSLMVVQVNKTLKKIALNNSKVVMPFQNKIKSNYLLVVMVIKIK